MRPVAIGSLGLVKFGECATIHELLAELFVLLSRTVAPVDIFRLHDRRPLGHPCRQAFIVAGTAHDVLLAHWRNVVRNFVGDLGNWILKSLAGERNELLIRILVCPYLLRSRDAVAWRNLHR